ncbi:WecB/TagA/CpsF family glycosyltransferase [Ruegeria arenilitoris]|uniref:WecB/TagA/CpsF family glycosyltransferase n=1 Tax=Ruegeria arenilitoris TaxID=1173585 RepID=UPI00147BD979|nr:WecB/TagA/CpsF family glycosyltransferase [Ruegeria arenilitoris]
MIISGVPNVANSAENPALPRVDLLNIYVHDVDMTDLVSNFTQGTILTLHTDMVAKLQRDTDFLHVFKKFDVVTCDSQILYFALRLMGTPVRERVSGSDYFPKFYMHHKDNPDVTVFLCGGKPGVAEIAADKINAKTGRKIIVGTDAPAFDYEQDPEEVDRIIDCINASGATVLLVGLGGGRQEKFIINYRDRMPNVRLFLPLGGTIDYEAGTLPRPAPWVTKMGLEWFYRLMKEPRQRWRRYLVDDPPVLWALLKQKMGLYHDPLSGN